MLWQPTITLITYFIPYQLLEARHQKPEIWFQLKSNPFQKKITQYLL